MVEVAEVAELAAVAAVAAVVVAAAAAALAAIMTYRVEVVDREVGLVTAAVVVNVGVNEEAETVVEVQEGSMAGVTVMAEDAAMVVDGVEKSHRSADHDQSYRSNP